MSKMAANPMAPRKTRQSRGGHYWIPMIFLALRLANALAVRTFFQPDEYFQSLEPAWSTALGPHSGAWITWVRGPRVPLPKSRS